MAVQAKIDRVDTLDAVEKWGALVRLVRRVRVVGLTADDDYAVLFTSLANAGVPAAGTKLDVGTKGANLILTERNVKLVDGDTGTVDVDLIYEHHLTEGQNLDTPPFGLIVGEVRASINQTTSNKDINGDAVVLTHVFPEIDTVTLVADPDYNGKTLAERTKVQGGEFQYFEPQITFTYQGIKTTNYPWLISNLLVGAINQFPWSGRAAHEWMCIGCSWRPHDRSVPGQARYMFSFEFQHNADTWDPQVVFIDDRTGKPATGLSEAEGSIKTVRKHREVNFEFVIGARVQGG